ncbi:hypothetical protein [Geobacillus sp. C56-T2]|uniref:hypothetical protein n=1 Tax=Geobacillus sp. C56-T2 TaxID=600773 RepID=UPI0011A41CBF|nr:hypothetical protein [Geobacillus sp. C56-T2]NNV04901.1 hypothetical protein [Geobacillus sp. MMMUD3]
MFRRHVVEKKAEFFWLREGQPCSRCFRTDGHDTADKGGRFSTGVAVSGQGRAADRSNVSAGSRQEFAGAVANVLIKGGAAVKRVDLVYETLQEWERNGKRWVSAEELALVLGLD